MRRPGEMTMVRHARVASLRLEARWDRQFEKARSSGRNTSGGGGAKGNLGSLGQAHKPLAADFTSVRLTAMNRPLEVDEEAGELDSLNPSFDPRPTRSHYALTRKEAAKNLANRFVHSRSYILLYLVMAALSVTTVGLSLADGCPGLAFYVLEIIVNSAMILEVGIRFLAFGKQFWKSAFNVVDLGLTCLCGLTLLVLAFAGCGATSKEEELLDTLLLVARNVLQFGRLAAVMRKSGQSIFSRPKPIDLSSARRAGYSLDIDIPEDDELEDARRQRVLFDAGGTNGNAFGSREGQRPGALGRMDDERDQTDVWASFG